jgi:glycosyltransferase involved in cell wall biosynthesis
MIFLLLTDLLDPDLGSEFQIALKAISAMARQPTAKIDLWTLERFNNQTSIKKWLMDKGLQDRVTLHLVPMRFAKGNGDHPTRLHFLADLLRLYREALRTTDANTVIWKSGQVNALFYLPFLFVQKKMVLGAISGLEYPPLRAIARNGPKSLLIKYSLYTLLIFLERAVFHFALRLRRHPLSLLFATQIDRSVFARTIAARPHILREAVYSEVDLEGILTSVPGPQEKKSEKETTCLLWSGALIHRKNPVAAVRVLAKAVQHEINIEALILGQGPLENQLIEEMKSVTGPQLTHSHGLTRKDFLAKLGHFDAVLVTSWREANSVFVFEALAAGCPVVAANISGMRDSVVHTGTLLDFDELTQPDYAAKILLSAAQRTDRKQIRGYVEALHNTELSTIEKVLLQL